MNDLAPSPQPAPDEALQLLVLALHAGGRLELQVLAVLLERLRRACWQRGVHDAWCGLASPADTAERSSSPQTAGLSPRELAVLRLVAIGRNNAEIGQVLAISRHTVATHLRSILAKTFTANRTEAAALAHREGLLSAAIAPAGPPGPTRGPRCPPGGR